MRTRRGAVSVGVALVATALAQVALGGGCVAFGVSSDPNDAAATLPDAMPATSDASMPDGASFADADAMISDGGCSHSFCADFEGTAADKGWSAKHVLSGALAIAPGVGLPGSALNSSIEAQTAPQDYAYLAQEFPGAVGFHLELEMKVPPATFEAATVITLVQLSGDVGGQGSGVGLVLSSQPTRLGFFIAHGDGSSDTLIPGFDVVRDKWLHVVFDLRFGKVGVVTVSVDGNVAVNQVIATAVPSTPELRIGVQHYNGATPALAVLYDTVLVDLLK
jgi:hypothetical protein